MSTQTKAYALLKGKILTCKPGVENNVQFKKILCALISAFTCFGSCEVELGQANSKIMASIFDGNF